MKSGYVTAPGNLWEAIGNLCLIKAVELLKTETAPTAATVETVSELVRIAIDVDYLNLQWGSQTRSGVEAPSALPLARTATKS